MSNLKQGDFMYEVKVFDNSGNLKKVISVKKLHIRSQKQLDTPYLFRKNKKIGRPLAKTPKAQAKTGTSQK